jgi:hypothetical protein
MSVGSVPMIGMSKKRRGGGVVRWGSGAMSQLQLKHLKPFQGILGGQNAISAISSACTLSHICSKTHSNFPSPTFVTMDALDSRKLSEATAVENISSSQKEEIAIQQNISHAPKTIQDALEIVKAKDVPESEIVRVCQSETRH